MVNARRTQGRERRRPTANEALAKRRDRCLLVDNAVKLYESLRIDAASSGLTRPIRFALRIAKRVGERATRVE